MPHDEELLSQLWSRLDRLTELLGIAKADAPPKSTQEGANRLVEALVALAGFPDRR